MTNTPITNESEAMEVWREARRAFNIVPNPYPNAGTEAAARVIATALEAKDARIRELEGALEVLRDLPIVENDNPDTLHLDGEAHTGPAVDYLFRIVRKVKEVARRALAKQEQQ